MFPNRYSEKTKDFKTEIGTRFSPVYSLKSKEAGNIELEVTGEKDVYSEIQSHRDAVDIKVIMARYQLGDESVLSKKQGAFIDVSDMPTNFADIMKTVITAEQNFNELPLDVRKEYDFNVAKYIADIGSEKWLKVLGINSNEEAKAIGESKEENVSES